MNVCSETIFERCFSHVVIAFILCPCVAFWCFDPCDNRAQKTFLIGFIHIFRVHPEYDILRGNQKDPGKLPKNPKSITKQNLRGFAVPYIGRVGVGWGGSGDLRDSRLKHRK